MSAEVLFAAIGGIGDDLIVKAESYLPAPAAQWRRWVPLAACAAIVISVGAFALFQGDRSANFKTESAPAAAEPMMAAASAPTEDAAPAEAPESAAAEECCPADAYIYANEAAPEEEMEPAPEAGIAPESAAKNKQPPLEQSENVTGDSVLDDLPPRAALLPELTLFSQTYTLLPDYQDGGRFSVDADLGELWAEVDGSKIYILGDEYTVVGQDMLYPSYVVCFTEDGDSGVYQIKLP